MWGKARPRAHLLFGLQQRVAGVIYARQVGQLRPELRGEARQSGGLDGGLGPAGGEAGVNKASRVGHATDV
jgi:hypothetical protein